MCWVHHKTSVPYRFCLPFFLSCSHVGFELWQVKAGTIFDDIIVTDDAAEAQAFHDETFAKKVRNGMGVIL